MAFLDLTRWAADDILDGGRPSGRDDDLVQELAFIRATRDVVPAPPMRGDLICLVDRCCMADG
jgi:hypothetical protein